MLTLLQAGWFDSWETMVGAAVFILYILSSILGGRKKPDPQRRREFPIPPPTPEQREDAPRPPPTTPAPQPTIPAPQPPRPTMPMPPRPSGPPRPPRTGFPRQPGQPPAPLPLPPRPPRVEPPRSRPATRPPAAPQPAPRRPEPVVRRPSPPVVQQATPRMSPVTAAHEEPEGESIAHRHLPEAAARPPQRAKNEQADRLRKVLTNRAGLRGALILAEILQPPLALREDHLQR